MDNIKIIIDSIIKDCISSREIWLNSGKKISQVNIEKILSENPKYFITHGKYSINDSAPSIAKNNVRYSLSSKAYFKKYNEYRINDFYPIIENNGYYVFTDTKNRVVSNSLIDCFIKAAKCSGVNSIYLDLNQHEYIKNKAYKIKAHRYTKKTMYVPDDEYNLADWIIFYMWKEKMRKFKNKVLDEFKSDPHIKSINVSNLKTGQYLIHFAIGKVKLSLFLYSKGCNAFFCKSYTGKKKYYHQNENSLPAFLRFLADVKAEVL